MWQDDVPEPTEALRQGDLLDSVPFSVLRAEPDVKETWSQVKWRVYPAIVISQCCTTQQRSIAELAAVVRTAALPADHGMVRGLLSGWPATAGELFFDGMLLSPVGSVVPEIAGGRYPHVAFRTRVTFTDDLEWLQQKRVARMTPEARRNLRLRLGAWYSRTEDDDRARLEEAGQFTGLHDQPDDAREGY